jgi:hypothetical protein
MKIYKDKGLRHGFIYPESEGPVRNPIFVEYSFLSLPHRILNV